MNGFDKIIALYIIICQLICKVFDGEPYLNQPHIFVTYDYTSGILQRLRQRMAWISGPALRYHT